MTSKKKSKNTVKKNNQNKNLSRRFGQLERLEDRMMLSATTVTADAPIVHAAFETAGFNFIYTGDTNADGAMAVEYRSAGSGGAWQPGHEGVKVESYPRVGGTPTQRFEYAGRLFGLTEGSDYEVRVTFSDPDGIVGPAVQTFTLSTRDPIAASTSGTTYYIDPNAGAGGNGSAGNPFDEIADTNTVVSSGDTIELLDGVHEMTDVVAFAANGTAAAPITITAAAGATPVVRGKLTGLEGSGTTWQDENATYPGVYSAPLADVAFQVYYDGEYLGESDSLANLVNGQRDHGALRDIDLDGAWYQTGGRLYVKIPQAWGDWAGAAVDPSALGVEPVVTDEGIFIQGSHWTIDGVKIEYFNTGLHVKNVASGRTGDNFTLRNSTFQFNKVGLKMNQSASILDDSGLNNTLIENNTFTGTPNYVSRNWTLGHDLYAVDAINANAFNGKNGVIRNNTISNMENGIYVGAWSQTPFSNPALTAGWVVRDNTLSNLGDDAVEVEGSGYQNVVIGNDIRQVLTGISVAPASVGPVWAISNTIYLTDLVNPLGQPVSNSLNGPFKFNSAPSEDGPLGPGTLLYSYHNSVYVSTTGTAAASSRIQVPTAGVRWTSRNDSFVLADGTGYAFLQLENLPTQYGVSVEDVFEYDFQYSNFWRSTDLPLAKVEDTVYQTLGDWQAAGFNTSGISSLSQFADPANGDFSVPAGTDLHDAGVHIPGINDSYLGTAPDIGAFEAAGTAGPRFSLDVQSGNGDGNFADGTTINISAAPPAGQVFDVWTGDTQYITDINAANTTLTMPGMAVTVSATFVGASQHTLTVQGGSGDGDYILGQVISISADNAAEFNVWTGDTQYIADINSPNTTLTMPDVPVTVTAALEGVATLYEVGKTGYPYSTVQAAVDAAFAQTTGSPTVRIMDSGVYDEFVAKTNAGTAGVNITIEAAPGQTPTLYGIQMWEVDATVVIQNLTFDGNLKDYTDAASGRQPQIVYLRASDNVTFQNNTVKGRGQYNTSNLHGETGSNITVSGNTFEADTIATSVNDTDSDVGTIVIEDNHFDHSAKGVDLSKANGAAAGTVTINNNLFNQNTTYGFYFRGSGSEFPGTTTIENNTFYKVGGNSQWEGGAIFLRESGDSFPDVVIRDNLIQGQGATTTNYDGFNSSDLPELSDLDADNNGFYDMREMDGEVKVASLGRQIWHNLTQLNALSSASNNLLGTSDPFVDAPGGDFRLLVGSWAASAASDGSFIGAFNIEQAVTTSADFDQDNDVDGADFLAWQRGFGTLAPDANKDDGDADNDLDVDGDDLTAWQTAYGQTVPLLATVVATDPAASVAITSVPSAAQQQLSLQVGLADAAMALLQPTFSEGATEQLVFEDSTILQGHFESDVEAVSGLALPTQTASSDGLVSSSEEESETDSTKGAGSVDEAIHQIWRTL